MGLRTVAFCATIKQSKALVQVFIERGIPSQHMDGSTGKAERDEILRRLQQNETQVVCSVGVLVEGFDMPQLEALLMLRPTKSKGKSGLS